MEKSQVVAQITCPCCSCFLRDPRLLPCLHTMCLECIAKHVTIPSYVECPVCHSLATIPTGGCNGFPVDLWKSSLLDLVPLVGAQSPATTTPPPPPECSECGSHNAAWTCTTCGVFLCPDDKAHHLRAKRTACHKVVTVEELKTRITINPTVHKLVFCPKHPLEELKLHCKTDKAMICCTCEVTDHKNHDFAFVSDLSSNFKETISSLSSKLRLHLEKISTSRLAAIECCKNTQEISEKVESEIHSEFAKIISLVNSREAQLLLEVKTIIETAQKTFQEHIDWCNWMLKVAQEAQEYAQQVTTSLSDLQVVSVNQALTTQIEKLCNSRDAVATPQQLEVRFECDSAAVCKAVSSLGRLAQSSTSTHMEKVPTPNTGRMKLKQFDKSVQQLTPRQGLRVFVDQTTGKVYCDASYFRMNLTEFQNLTDFENNVNPRAFCLRISAFPEGTYQAVLNGHIYCNQYRTATITKARLSDGAMVASANLPNAGHTNQSHWIWGGNTDICWFADTGGVLYVVYAPPPPDEGNIHISLVDPGTLALQQTWVVPRVKKQTGFAFAVSGRFYFGSPNGNSLQQIDGVFDTATNEYDGSYRNALPTTSPGSIIYLTSWLPATNQLLVVFLDSGMYQTLLLDNAAVVEQHS